jgi:PPOX class probable F420-dependent enzyme
MTISDRARTFLARQGLYATIATIDADGAPRQAVVWYRLENDGLILNSKVGRRWPTNLLRDPRIAVAVNDPGPDELWVGLTGTAEPIEDQATAQADIAEMAHRYIADQAEADRIVADTYSKMQRISFRVTVEKVHEHFD